VVRGGAFGHGVYNGIGGTPIFYWLNQAGAATVTLSSLSVKDASGNTRSFVLYAPTERTPTLRKPSPTPAPRTGG